MVLTEKLDYFVKSVPLVQHKMLMKVVVLLVISISLFILIASENMLHLTRDISIYINDKYINESPKSWVNKSHLTYDIDQSNVPHGSNDSRNQHSDFHHGATFKPRLLCEWQKNPTFIKKDKREQNRAYEVNISTIDMQLIEDMVFGDARASAETYIEDVSAALMTSGSDKLTPYYKNHTAFIETDSKNILLGNYTYSAGGRWRPINCVPKWKVAIVIPFRNRTEHLAILIRNLLQVLTLQNLEFGIFVVEQANDLVFNRGLLKNIGYMESTNFGAWDCVIFHDVDQVPMRATNSYGCENMPKHLCAYAEEMEFILVDGALFGGVIGISAEQMKRSNGYSNVYWGWGGEDDDIRSRLIRMKYKINRASEGYYKTLEHKKKTDDEKCQERYCLMSRYAERLAWDGISHTRYNANVTLNLLFTHIAVDVRKEEWNTYECKE